MRPHPRAATLVAFLCALCPSFAHGTAVILNEFQASNSATLADEDGDYPDWIELFNRGEAPVNLDGFALSDDASNPFRWLLPGITLEPGAFLLVFASGKDRHTGPHLHTNFSISATGEEILLTAPSGETLDYVAPIAVPMDLSHGRQPDGATDWYFFDKPTPDAPNTPTGYAGILDPPLLSHAPGYYTAAFDLTASHSDPDAALHYTLDGSLPKTSASRLDAPLSIVDRSGEPDTLAPIPTSSPNWWTEPIGPGFKGTALRVQAHRSGWLPSRVITRTYFVTPQGSARYELPTVSLVTDAKHFFSNPTGIHVLGDRYDGQDIFTANFFRRGRSWERPVHLELLENDGTVGLVQDLGLRIHGGGTRFYAQKSLRLIARNEYDGASVVEYPLIPDLYRADGSDLTTFRRFLLRNTGQDFTDRGAMLRDWFMQSLVFDMERIETQGGRPAVVFLNGEFWGLFYLRERYDPDYFAEKYGLDPGRVSILVDNATRESGTMASRNGYVALREYAVANDLSDPAHYAHVTAQLDPISKIDYWLANIYFHNTDWPQTNIRYWRYEPAGDEPHEPDAWWRDGRWRWMMFDTDVGFLSHGPYSTPQNSPFLRAFEGQYGSLWSAAANTLKWTTLEQNGYNLLTWPNELFRALLDNEDFRTTFIVRFADRLNSNFREEHVLDQLDQAAARVESIMPEQLNRWRQLFTSMLVWNQNVNRMRNFAAVRPGFVREHIVEEFNLAGVYELRIQLPPPGSGRLRINTIELEADGSEWVGIYFRELPLEVAFEPAQDWAFLGWQGDVVSDAQTLRWHPEDNVVITPHAQFEGLELHEVVLPRYMQGTSPDNNDRVPYACRLRIEGLLPDAPYRYANRVVTAAEPLTQNGAGNALYFDADTGAYFRTTATPDFAEPGTYGEFVTDGQGAFEGWFLLEPSGNPRFGEPSLFIRILLNDGMGGEAYAHFLTTANSVAVLPFGPGPGEATGLYATSPMGPQRIAVLHDDPEGTMRPLTATIVEPAGFSVDERYAAFYLESVTGKAGRFGALLPNTLPGGLVRIEERDRESGALLDAFLAPDGRWPGGIDTTNPGGGLDFPIPLAIGIPSDINRDGAVNAVDVQIVINAALGVPIDPAYNADVNGDGVVNAVDVQLVINAALGV